MLTRSPGRIRRTLTVSALALLPASLAVAALQADNEPTRLLVDGDFETGVVSLRLPEVSPFPLVAGGWGARTDGTDAIGLSREAFSGNRSLQIISRRDVPAHVIQDAPVATRGWVLDLAVQRLRGRQSIALLGEWDRMDPDAVADVRIELRAGGLRVMTARGSWQVTTALEPGVWTQLRVTADPRRDLLSIEVNGILAATVPGVPITAPRTLVMGGNPGGRGSRFRYDGARLQRLAEIELAELRLAVLRDADPTIVDFVQRRLESAAAALGRGAGHLAAPELRAAARLLSSGTEELAGGPLETAALELADLAVAG